MREFHRQVSVLGIAAVTAALGGACGAPSASISPATLQSPSAPSAQLGAVPQAAIAAVGANTAIVCHVHGNGTFSPLAINPQALPAHLAHGDGQIGGAVPGQAGSVFGTGCAIEPVLTCTAPSTAIVGVATVFAATGGSGAYAWSGGGVPATGTGAEFSTVFASVGSKTVTVLSDVQTRTCAVNVAPPQPRCQIVSQDPAVFGPFGSPYFRSVVWQASGGTPPYADPFSTEGSTYSVLDWGIFGTNRPIPRLIDHNGQETICPTPNRSQTPPY